MEKNFVARIMANIKNFERNINKAQRLAKSSIPREVTTDVDAKIGKFQRALMKAKAMAQKFRHHTVKVDVDTSAMSKMRKAFGAVEREIQTFQGRVDRLAGDIRSFGTVFAQTFKGVMLTAVQGLIPVIGGLVPALFAVLNAVKALSGGVVALAGVGAIGLAGFASYAFMAASAIKMLGDGTIEASKHTKAYEDALEGVKSQWQEIIKMNADSIFQSMANGLNAMKSALKSLTPFFSGVAKGVEKASASLLKWTQTSAVAKKFFNMLNTTGVSVFNKLLSAAGRFGDGLVNVFTQLAPLFQWSVNWLNRLGKSFQTWANSANGKNSIKQFMEYTKTNLPIIGNIFKNVFAGIANLMKAFGKNSTNIFKYLEQMSAKFREWSKTVGESQGFKNFVNYMQENGPVIMKLIGNIVRALVAFGTAMAPIASAILKVVTKIVEFTATLMENHPWVAKMAGIALILMGALWSLMMPLMAVNGVLGLFGTSILGLITKFAQAGVASKIFGGIMTVLKNVFKFLVNPIGMITRALPALGTAFTTLTGPIGIVLGAIALLVGGFLWLWQTNETFRDFMTETWEKITTAVSGAIQGIIGWFQQLWGSIQTTLQPIMPILQLLGDMFGKIFGIIIVTVISNVILAFQALWAIGSIVFQVLGMAIQIFVNTVVSLFTIIIQLLTGDFAGAWETLKNMISTNLDIIWSTISNIWGIITDFLGNAMETIKGLISTAWSIISGNTKSKVQEIWNSITSKFSEITNDINQKVTDWVNKVNNGFVNMVQSAIDGMGRFLQSIVDGFWKVVDGVKSGVSDAVSAAKSFVGDMMDAGGDLINGLIDGIKNGAKAVADAARSVANKAVAAAKSALGIHSPSRVFRGIGGFMMKGMENGISGGQGGAISAVSKAASLVTDAFNTNLDSNLTDGVNANLGGNVDKHLTKDVRHSMTENSRPIVNLNVHNESDLPAIKTWLDDTQAREGAMSY
ncbi:terminase [Staphylococcus equorum]|uniref:phage tail protein n=1 Tax=Staphylococcus equorum TaxID=246432 RepID=UPI00203E8934|nr:terminase [Staphylococcus equorum]MCM3071735.1 terminase [Staphylococcus equorum]